MPFLDDLDVRVIRKGEVKLLRSFRYQVPDGPVITVPAGFESDFASIPSVLRPFLTGTDKSRKPAIIHDWLYLVGKGTRKRADQIFRLALKEEGLGWKRHVAYWSVRVFGLLYWNG